MRGWMVAAMLVLAACGGELLAPEPPRVLLLGDYEYSARLAGVQVGGVMKLSDAADGLSCAWDVPFGESAAYDAQPVAASWDGERYTAEAKLVGGHSGTVRHQVWMSGVQPMCSIQWSLDLGDGVTYSGGGACAMIKRGQGG